MLIVKIINIIIKKKSLLISNSLTDAACLCLIAKTSLDIKYSKKTIFINKNKDFRTIILSLNKLLQKSYSFEKTIFIPILIR